MPYTGIFYVKKRKYNIIISYDYCHPSFSNPRGVLLNLRLLNRVIMKPLLSLYVILVQYTLAKLVRKYYCVRTRR